MVSQRGRVRRVVARVVKDDNLDLYILAAAAAVFTVLGTVGVASVVALSSATLALLALLATSQIRTRRHVSELVDSRQDGKATVLLTTWPSEGRPLKPGAQEILLVGVALSRAVQNARDFLRHVLQHGGHVRVLLLDPTDAVLVRSAVPHYSANLDPSRVAARIRTSLDELTFLGEVTGGRLELRVAPFVPAATIHGYDLDSPGGVIAVQYNEYRPQREPSPIFHLRDEDGYWYQHFAAQAKRMWDDGRPWPPSHDRVLAAAPRPTFVDDFGPALINGMDAGQDLLITGVARNTLVNSNYHHFERWLQEGRTIRLLVVDPASDAIAAAAERYYAERSADSTRDRIQHTLRLLTELKRTTGGNLTVRLTAHPLAIGLVAVDPDPSRRTTASAAFLEYYTFQAAREPKFVLQPGDGAWFSHFIAEAEALWASSKPFQVPGPSQP